MRLSWVQPQDLVAHELVQSAAEGRDVSQVRRDWVAAGGPVAIERGGARDESADLPARDVARVALERLDALPAPKDPARPEGLDAITASARGGWRAPSVPTDLLDRIEGAWTGRAAGCLLGKPVEKIPRQGIREILDSTGRWPLAGYFTASGLPPAVAERWPWNRRSASTSLVENIDGMPEDDDLNYPMLNLGLLERRGRWFTVDDVAEAWLDELPAGRVFTAERLAYRNLLDGVAPADAARVRNPFREWIGALIRADVFGWVSPGDPQGAAAMAFEDARLSHTGDGVYGAMWVAGMSAAAVVTDSVDDVLEAGASVVPPTSALADAVAFGAALGRSRAPIDDDLDALGRRFGDLHWVHVLNNSATIAWALVRGAGRFTDSVPLAVMAGWDTDSAGATVGALCGALAGRSGLPASYVAPLQDRIATSLPGRDEVRISELAVRTAKLAVIEVAA